LLDELAVPQHEVADAGATTWQRLGLEHPARGLYWHAAAEGVAREHSVWGNPVFGRVAGDETVARLARELPGRWRREAPVLSGGGQHSWVWRSDDGGTILPFDPDELLANYRSEAYLRIGAGAASPLKAFARRAYYRARPLIPRRAQIAARRSFSRAQAHSSFPRWPVETALHDLVDRVLALVAEAADAALPYLAPWPRGHTWALVLTHDVETETGRDAIDRVRSVETALGLRSAWNLVPERYHVPDDLVARLTEAGCEVGVHGLRHDGRDLESLRTLRRRLPEMRRWAERWGAVGFRSPATHRVWDWMPELGFDYDSSSPDTDPYEPMSGGCCSWHPFFNRRLVELPLTLAQDHTIFTILGISSGVWHDKAELLRRRGGMALIDTHPDYMLDDAPLSAYERFLSAFGADPDVWVALPRDVSAWWRRRAATSLELVGGTWTAVGPAADDAAVAFATPRAHAARGGP
jgi:hypothetical protein